MGVIWTTSWAASIEGGYPRGNPVLPTNLEFAFPGLIPKANNQTFRLVISPTIWGHSGRLRFSNAFGLNSLALSDTFFGLQASAGELVPNTNVAVTFDGSPACTIDPGQTLWSDPFLIPWVSTTIGHSLYGRKASVSFHVMGTNSPISWHSKALRTSYITEPWSNPCSADERDIAYTQTSSACFYLDAFDVADVPDAAAIVAFGDSLTDGTGSTINGDDRWPDALFRRLYRRYGNRYSVLNAGIGGNKVLTDHCDGGPAALSRLTRDVLSLSNLRTVIWLQGTNDLLAGVEALEIINGITRGVALMRGCGVPLTLIQATLTPIGEAYPATYDISLLNMRRKQVNHFIRSSDIFDGVIDFDAVLVDSITGTLQPKFLPDSSTGRIDQLHPNRAGYSMMANAVDLDLLNARPSR